MNDNDQNGTAAEEPGNGVAIPDDGDNQLVTFPPAQPPEMSAIATLREHVAASEDAVKFANGVCYTALVPDRFRGKPQDGAAAILYGAELGLKPIVALQRVIVIHGTPGLEARTMKGLLKGKGYGFRTVERSAEAHEIWAWEPDAPREYDADGYRINPDEVARYTMERAIQAGYVPTPTANSQRRPTVQSDWVTVNRGGKTSILGNMKYITEPENMLKAKATAEVCRDIAPHILLGMPFAAEELDDFDDGTAAPPRPARQGGKGVDRLRERAAAAAGRKGGEQLAEAVDADVVDDPNPVARAVEVIGEASAFVSRITDNSETAPAPAPDDAPTAATASPEPAPAPEPDEGDPESAGDGMAADKGGEGPATNGIPPPSPAPGDDLEMSPQNRAKGLTMLIELLGEADITGGDQLAVVAEILAQRDGATYRPFDESARVDEQLSNRDLKYVVDRLRAKKQAGILYDYVGEALNAASLREAGLADS